jgi:hypothetical protein
MSVKWTKTTKHARGIRLLTEVPYIGKVKKKKKTIA